MARSGFQENSGNILFLYTEIYGPVCRWKNGQPMNFAWRCDAVSVYRTILWSLTTAWVDECCDLKLKSEFSMERRLNFILAYRAHSGCWRMAWMESVHTCVCSSLAWRGRRILGNFNLIPVKNTVTPFWLYSLFCTESEAHPPSYAVGTGVHS
jgi:hypothetical protein